MSEHNFVVALAALFSTLEPSGVYEAHVKHDTWCAFLNGGGRCNCSPEILVERVKAGDEPEETKA